MAPAATAPTSTQPFFGRTELREELTERLRETRSGVGRFWLVLGRGGSGKSSFLAEAERSAGALGFQTLAGRAPASDLPEPFALVSSLLRSARGSGRGDAGDGSSVLSLFLIPHVLEAGPEGRPSGRSDSAESREVDRLIAQLSEPIERIDANRGKLFADLTDFLFARAAERPLLIVLDDVHSADPLSLAFLSELVPQLIDHPVMLLAAALPLEEAPPRSATGLRELVDRAGTSPTTLRPMSEPELGEFVRWLLKGRDPGQDAVTRWYTQTDGNPLFAEHLVRASVGLGPRPEAEAEGDLREVMRRRIRALPEAERTLLLHGAILGREFRFSTLALSLGTEEERLAQTLDHLVREGLLREKAGEVYEFVSEQVRADLYAGLTETRRRILHRKAASALQRQADSGGVSLFELARQSYLGRLDADSVGYNRRAAEIAAEGFSVETAIVHVERALESARRLQPRDPGLELRLLVELGRFLETHDDLARSEAVLLDAVARARSAGGPGAELALGLLGLARTRYDLAHYASAVELATEAYTRLEQLGQRRGLMAAHQVLGACHWRLGHLPEAERHQRAAIAIAEAEGTHPELGHALIDLANTLSLQRAEEALRLYDRAQGLLGESRDFAAQARVLMNRSLLQHHLGRIDEATRDLENALVAAEHSRSRVWIAYCCLNLAQFHAERHAPAAGRPLLERARGILEALGDQLALQQAAMITGMIAQEEGRFPEAEEAYSEALRLARELGLEPEVAEMHYRRARLAFARGDRELARRLLHEARGAGLDRHRIDLADEVAGFARALSA